MPWLQIKLPMPLLGHVPLNLSNLNTVTNCIQSPIPQMCVLHLGSRWISVECMTNEQRLSFVTDTVYIQHKPYYYQRSSFKLSSFWQCTSMKICLIHYYTSRIKNMLSQKSVYLVCYWVLQNTWHNGPEPV